MDIYGNRWMREGHRIVSTTVADYCSKDVKCFTVHSLTFLYVFEFNTIKRSKINSEEN